MLLFFFSPCDEAHKRQPSPLLNFLFVKAGGGVTSRCVTEWLIDFFSNWFKPHISYVTFIFKAGPRLSRWKINWSSLYVSLPVRRSVGRVEDYGKGGGCADVHSWLTGQIQYELTPSAFGNRLSEAPLSDRQKERATMVGCRILKELHNFCFVMQPHLPPPAVCCVFRLIHWEDFLTKMLNIDERRNNGLSAI